MGLTRFSTSVSLKHQGKVFLAIASVDAAAGIVITAEDTKKNLDAGAKQLPDHVLFKINGNTYTVETRKNYPFHYIGKER